MYVDMNCQQICKISRKKTQLKVKIFQKVLGGATFFLKHHMTRPSPKHYI